MAPQIEDDIRLGFAARQRNIRKEPLVLLARCHLFGPGARSIVEAPATLAQMRNPFLEVSQNAS